MAQAVTCPVCEGTGRVQPTDGSTEPKALKHAWSEPCHGCAGKGWVEVGNDAPFYPVTYPDYAVPPSTETIWYPMTMF